MSNLNLARKWRPQTFNQIVGQDLSVSMLKNGLYLKKLFPVYLFSGQRGCGKTSTARVFAAAINCHKLSQFRKDPKQTIPCLQCVSCKAMLQTNHPDFIEMDAASHTGVDSVRQIIESSSYMPLSGDKKIYLIDEAHMLSKAAFNAFLKILEEPPTSVLFILATTNPEKIPDTVKSRCFQALFNAVEIKSLGNHIKTICKSEKIEIDDEAITLLVQETEGSVRDSINALERVRFTGSHITKDLVLKTLGKISEEELLKLISSVIEQSGSALLKQLQTMNFESLSAQNIWSMLILALRDILRIHYGIESNSKQLKAVAEKSSKNKTHQLLHIFWKQEDVFLRTPNKHLFLETLLLRMCEINQSKEITHANAKSTIQIPVPQKKMSHIPVSQTSSSSEPWSRFVSRLDAIKDPMLAGIFRSANFIREKNNIVSLQLQNHSIFIIDKINETENLWKSQLIKSFPNFIKFEFEADKNKKKTIKPVNLQPAVAKAMADKPLQTIPSNLSKASQPVRRSFGEGGWQQNRGQFATQRSSGFQGRPGPKGTPIDTSDTSMWPKATLLTQSFSGVVEKVNEHLD